jgi:glutamyl/glutaminyl-tRNA synthetase
VGVAKRNNVIDVGLLEFALRDHLNSTATRAMAVLRPLKMVILNYPKGEVDMLPTVNNPENPAEGTRDIPFGRELFIEAEDFKVEGVNKKWFRLAPGRSVRLKSAYIVTYVDHKTDDAGNVTEVHVEYHPNSKSGSDTSGIKAKGTLHWVECTHAKDAEVRLYERLFSDPNPDSHKGHSPGMQSRASACGGETWPNLAIHPSRIFRCGFQVQPRRQASLQSGGDPQGRLEGEGLSPIRAPSSSIKRFASTTSLRMSPSKMASLMAFLMSPTGREGGMPNASMISSPETGG